MATNYTGAMHPANLDSTQRKYSKSDKAKFLKPSAHPLMTLLTDRMQKRKVTDIEYDTFSYPYPTLSGKVYGYSAGSAIAITATDTTVYIANAEKFLIPGDMLKIDGLQANNTATKTVLGEIVRVTGTPAANCATITRNWASGTACANTATTGLNWQFIGNAERLGATSRIAKGDAINAKRNYIQTFNQSWSILDILEQLDYYGPDERTRMKELALIRLTAGIEYAMIYGQKVKTTENGNDLFTTGGLQYWLNLTDADEGVDAWATTTDLVTGTTSNTSRIWRPQGVFTIPLFEKFVERGFKYGEKTKLGLHGAGWMRQFRNLFGDQIRLERQDTKRGVTINNYNADGFTIQFVYEPAMDIEDNCGLFLVDLPQISYCYINDIHPRNNLQANDATETKGEFRADVGFGGEFVLAHSYIKDLTDILP